MLLLFRVAHVAATLGAFGTCLFTTAILSRVDGQKAGRPNIRRCAMAFACIALVTEAGWVLLQAADMASLPLAGLGEALGSALPAMLLHTWFGQVQCLRLLLLALALASTVFIRSTLPAATTSGLATALLGVTGHLSTAGDSALEAIGLSSLQALHLLAAGAWLGALPALFLSLHRSTPLVASQLSRRFSPIGIVAVTVIVLSGAVNGYTLTGSLAGLLGTTYGRLLLIKSALLCVLLAFAWRHRFRVTPALETEAKRRGRTATPTVQTFARSVLAETAVGLLLVAVAGLLASSAPAMHEQPWWPLPFRFSREVLDDPDLGPPLLHALIAVAAALALLPLMLLSRRARWPALVLAVLLGLYAQPQLGLLTAPAYPTSFYMSPASFDPASIMEGQRLFAANCVACHGSEGRGDGPGAKGLAIAPADLTADHLWDHPDGDLFWWIGHGIVEDGKEAMPGFASVIDEPGRWALIDFLHANNAAHMEGSKWERPIQAPDFPIRCDAPGVGSLSDLHGAMALIAIDPSPSTAETLETGAARLQAAGIKPVISGRSAPSGLCFSDSAEVLATYRLLLNSSAKDGGYLLLDTQGLLRTRHAGAIGPEDLDSVLKAADEIRRTPIQAPAAHSMAGMRM